MKHFESNVRISDVHEALMDFRSLSNEILADPVNSTKRFKLRLENCIASGSKLLYYLALVRDTHLLKYLEISQGYVNYILNDLRIHGLEICGQKKLKTTAIQILNYFEETLLYIRLR